MSREKLKPYQFGIIFTISSLGSLLVFCFKKNNFVLISIISLLFLASCNHFEKRGYSFELSDHEVIKKDISDLDMVLNVMGSPSFVSGLNDEEIWVYYEEKYKKFLFFRPDILDRKIMTLSFNKNYVVSGVNYISLKDENDLNFVSDYTKVQSQKKGFFSEIFGNIGQVRPN